MASFNCSDYRQNLTPVNNSNSTISASVAADEKLYLPFFEFVISVILLFVVALPGLAGNFISVFILSRPQMRTSLNVILIGNRITALRFEYSPSELTRRCLLERFASHSSTHNNKAIKICCFNAHRSGQFRLHIAGDVNPAVRAAFVPRVHGRRAVLHALYQPVPHAVHVPSGPDGADGVRLFDLLCDRRTLRGRVPSAEGALVVHLRPRARCRLRHRLLLARLQHPALLRSRPLRRVRPTNGR